MFKVGDWVIINPKYMTRVDTVRGVISSETIDFDPSAHIIDWEDGSKGIVRLNHKSSTRYLTLV